MPTQTQQLSIDKLSAIYDRIYNIADRLFKKYNLCDIHIENKCTVCLEYTLERLKTRHHTNNNSLCCNGCKNKHHSKNGCTVKCLACKLYVCGAIQYKYKNHNLVRMLKRLKKTACYYGLPTHSFFVSKKEYLNWSEHKNG